MNNYVIIADSVCDLSQETLNEWEIKTVSLTFTFNGDSKEYYNNEMPLAEFYERMRNGGVARTSACNVEYLKGEFAPILEEGKDIIYIAFSSGLSTTYNSGRMAVEELREQYPDRKIFAIDSLSASTGYGLLLYLAVQKKREGAAIEELADYVTERRLHICHWFTVEDLKYLKRGGRVSPTVALVGTLLGIKPVLHMDDEGHLINMSKTRGRKNAIQALADKFGELAVDKTSGPVFISHGDCREDADELAGIIKSEYGVDVSIISYIGPVIGSHSGPGTLALYFVGKER